MKKMMYCNRDMQIEVRCNFLPTILAEVYTISRMYYEPRVGKNGYVHVLVRLLIDIAFGGG